MRVVSSLPKPPGLWWKSGERNGQPSTSIFVREVGFVRPRVPGFLVGQSLVSLLPLKFARLGR